MSSSLLLVLIVVVWLFVLAPLVINRREPIRRTSEALGKTRVVHRGGETLTATRRRPTFSERDIRRSEEVDESLETVDAAVEDDRDVDDMLYDDTVGTEDAEQRAPEVVDGDVVWELERGQADADAVADADATAGARGGSAVDADGNLADTHQGTNSTADAQLDTETDADLRADLSTVSDTDSPLDAAVADAAVADAAHDTVTASLNVTTEYVDEDDLMFDVIDNASGENSDADDVDGSEHAADADAEGTDSDLEGTDADAEGTDSDLEGSADRPEQADDFDDTLTPADYAFAERRRGRGGFDPVTDAHYARTRFARRRRSVAGLAGFILVALVLAIAFGGWTWWLPLLGVGLMAVYLVFLRRTVRAENELRRRRIRRMKLARQGVRNIEDDELGIPQRLRRPGAVVVELDDEDPEFADIPYGDLAAYTDDDVRRYAG